MTTLDNSSRQELPELKILTDIKIMNHEPVHKIIESWQNDYGFKFESEIFWTVYYLDGFEKSVGNQLYNISCFFIGQSCGIIDSAKIAHATF